MMSELWLNHRWSFTDDDAADGSCNLKVTGLRRFRLGRQWQNRCAGCNTGPLHYADVVYFNDTAKLSEHASQRAWQTSRSRCACTIRY